MTATPCFGPDDVERVASLSAGHELRAHARECPRCGALLASFALYHDDVGGPSASQIEDADARLSVILSREIGTPNPAPLRDEQHTVGATRARAGDSRDSAEGWVAKLLHPSMRPLLALGVLVVVAGAVLFLPRPVEHNGPETLRGGSESTVIAIEHATLGDTAAVVVWQPKIGTEHYEVRLYSGDMQELGRFPAALANQLSIPRASIPATGTDGRILYRVYAFREDHVIATSPATELPTHEE